MKLVAVCSFSDFNDAHSDGINSIYVDASMQTSVTLIGILIVECY